MRGDVPTTTRTFAYRVASPGSTPTAKMGSPALDPRRPPIIDDEELVDGGDRSSLTN
jgi:hypothetical protein